MTASPLLRPFDDGRLRLPNRIVMAPMTRGRADDETAVPHPLTKEYYAQRAGAGLIVSEGLWPDPLGKGGPGIPGLVTDAHVAGWREVTDAVHAAGGRIFAQLWHVGRMTHPVTLPDGEQPVAPSAVRIENQRIFTKKGLLDHVTPRAMTTAEVEALVAAFAAEARNAIRAGFDGVEVHGANGYLIQQFLAENTNRRTDRYGGSLTRDACGSPSRSCGPWPPRSDPTGSGCASPPTTRRTRSPRRTRGAPTGRWSTR